MTRRSRAGLTALLAGLAALILTVTTACTPGATDVHIDELGEETESIGESFLATIEGVDRDQRDGINSGWTWDNREAGERDPSAKRRWGWEAMIDLAEDAEVTAEEAAARMAEVLASSGEEWAVTEPGNDEGGGTWEFRRPADRGDGSWYVGIDFSRDDGTPAPPQLRIAIISPYTSNRAESQKTKQRDAARDTPRQTEQAAPRSNRAGLLPDGTFDPDRFR